MLMKKNLNTNINLISKNEKPKCSISKTKLSKLHIQYKYLNS